MYSALSANFLDIDFWWVRAFEQRGMRLLAC